MSPDLALSPSRSVPRALKPRQGSVLAGTLLLAAALTLMWGALREPVYAEAAGAGALPGVVGPSAPPPPTLTDRLHTRTEVIADRRADERRRQRQPLLPPEPVGFGDATLLDEPVGPEDVDEVASDCLRR